MNRKLIVGVVVGNVAGCVARLWFDPRAGQTRCRRRLVTSAMFLWSCVVQALSRGDGLHHSLHASM